MSIRVRFAPSPTGYLHVGSLRTALYNYLFARNIGGEFILRIEDTDRTRYVPGAIEALIDVLNKIGLDYDEGPILDKAGKLSGEKGSDGPYIQSERSKVYSEYAHKLVDNGKAYRCFCTKERLDSMKQEQQQKKQVPRYDGKCRNLSENEIKTKLQNKLSYTIRLKVPKDGITEFTDLTYGKIQYKNINLDDQVLLKSDGYPTYHLANTIDDHLMRITHVIRGEEWLPSTPKHVLIYQAFGWNLPVFVHLPLLLNKDKTKISKRQEHIAVEEYLKEGYLPEAMLNFILLLGWNPKTDQEIFSIDEMIKKFTLKNINKSGAVFDLDKLNNINSEYIRSLSEKKFTESCLPYLIKKKLVIIKNGRIALIKRQLEIDKDKLGKILMLDKERIHKLSDVGEETSWYFTNKLDYSKDLLFWKKTSRDDTKKALNLAEKLIEEINQDEFNDKNIEKQLMKAVNSGKIKAGELLWPLRVSLTGKEKSPSPFEVASALGKKETINRIKVALSRI